MHRRRRNVLNFIKTKKIIEDDSKVLDENAVRKWFSHSDICQRSLELPKISSITEDYEFDHNENFNTK